jgi:hypothetical protein
VFPSFLPFFFLAFAGHVCNTSQVTRKGQAQDAAKEDL